MVGGEWWEIRLNEGTNEWITKRRQKVNAGMIMDREQIIDDTRRENSGEMKKG